MAMLRQWIGNESITTGMDPNGNALPCDQYPCNGPILAIIPAKWPEMDVYQAYLALFEGISIKGGVF